MSEPRGSDDTTRRLSDTSLRVEHSKSGGIIRRLVDVSESLSAEFGKWGEQYVSGPSLYFVLVADANYDSYTDPLGENKWPINTSRLATGQLDAFVSATREVAFSCDGAIVVTVDGTVQEQMVRVKSSASPTEERREEIEYADWMGTKHLSASEVSTRDEVLAAVTLSEENGRVTLFQDGNFSDNQRDELGGRWFADESSL